MARFYLTYLLFGIYVAERSLLSWAFPSFNKCNQTVSLMALIGSCTLIFIATPLVVYNLKRAKILALACFAAILPFAVYWLNYIYHHRVGGYSDQTASILLAACVYFISIIVTLKNINDSTQHDGLNKWVRLALAVLPVVFMTLNCFYWFI